MNERVNGCAKFVVFSVARSGTSFLTTSLRSHPDILCHGEALLPRHIPKHLHGSARSRFTAADCENDPLGFFHELLKIDDGHIAVGCKVFRGHSPTVHNAILEDASIRKILLDRENRLASYSSGLIARETGRWSSRRSEGIEKLHRVSFDKSDFERYRNRVDGFFRKVARKQQGPSIRITYEENVLGESLAPIFHLLDVQEDVKTESPKKKQLGRSIWDRFSNPEDVLEYLNDIGKPLWAEE